MTGYTVHTGATEQFVAGWDKIFKKQAKAKARNSGKKKKPAAAKKKTAMKIVKSKARKVTKRKN